MEQLRNIYYQTEAIILAHGYVGEILGKTVNGILMHSTVFNTVALVDRIKAGQDTSKICPGVTRQVPICSTVKEAMAFRPKVAILIGDPSEKNLDELLYCINLGMDIINSSFVFLIDFPELAALAREKNTRLVDLRNVKRVWRMADGSILGIKAKVVYVTGTDCGLGKRTAAYELAQEAKKRGINAAFAATGQTGMMIGCEGGIVFDAISTNFSAGAVEELIVTLDKEGYELIFLEGQASLMHFGGSTVLTLLHASNPHAVVLVHDPSRQYHVVYGNTPIFKMCGLQREINLIESLYLPGGNRYKVVAVPSWGEENLKKTKRITHLPVADVRKPGGREIILDAVLQHLEKEYMWKPSESLVPGEEVVS
jgi:uncharacterized NAD-dependent epimerase/dehydratase family protein